MAKVNIQVGKFSVSYGADSPISPSQTANKAAVPNSAYNGAFDGARFMEMAGMLNAQSTFFDIDSTATIIKAVNECPQVSTILFKRAANHANAETQLLDLQGNPLTGTKLNAWKSVFDKPNAFMNRAQYVMLRDIFLFSYGWCFEYKEMSEVGPEYMTRRILDPQYCEITWKRQTLFGVMDRNEMIDKFFYSENGVRVEILDKENLYCYVNPGVFAKNKGFLPESPLKTLKYPINNSIINYRSRNRLIKKPFGALTGNNKDDVSAIPLTDDERKDLQRAYRENYGTEDGQDDMIISQTALSFVPFMYPIKDLQLLELLKSDSAAICDRMGYEFDLLARDLGGVALNNKNEAGKNQYQNHEIPHAINVDEQEMESIDTLANGFSIHSSFAHLPIMQEDKKVNSETLRNNVGALTIAFKNNQCSYDDMINTIGVSEPTPKWTGKWWFDFSDEEKALFDSTHNNSNNANNNQNTNTGGNQGNQGNSGNNN